MSDAITDRRSEPVRYDRSKQPSCCPDSDRICQTPNDCGEKGACFVSGKALRFAKPAAPQQAAPKPEGDAVVLPKHYTRWKIEPITFLMENGVPFPEGNVIKYVMRWRDKNGVEDLKKARRYLDMMIEAVEAGRLK